MSASPECLIRKSLGEVSTRPIAGTRKKKPGDEGLEAVVQLRRDPKEQAEHAMLVDLSRNDLSRISQPGSVVLRELCEIVECQTLYHIESEVAGTVRQGLDSLSCLMGMFPGGTITGVPKRRTMELIRELEPNSRGIYTGSLGYFSFAGDMDFNILIRSILFKDGWAHLNGGGGITIDATSHLEFKETINKVRAQLMALA